MSNRFQGIPYLREPGEESADLYPGLVVCDDRVTGSITAGRTRLPLWCLINELVGGGFPAIEVSRNLGGTGLTADVLGDFLYYLLEQRGDFGRLLLVLADVERQAMEREKASQDPDSLTWWQDKGMRQRVIDALERCLNDLKQSGQ